MKCSVEGELKPRFERVRRVFEENFTRRGEIGASLCVWYQGEQVIDLWGGTQVRGAEVPWEPDTLTTVFSCTKGVAAMCLLKLVEQGALDLEAPVSRYWPEFGVPVEGPNAIPEREKMRASLTVRTLLNHRAGLVGLRAPLSLDELEDLDVVAARLAREPLAWVPGEQQGYHAITYGLLVAELFRRVAGEQLGPYISRALAGPLGADFFMGLPPEEDGRCASIIPNELKDILTGVLPSLLTRQGNEGRFYRGALLGGAGKLAFGQPAALGARGLKNFNTARVRRLQLAWANGMSNARGLARLYQGLLGGEIVAPALLKPLQDRQSWQARDSVIRKPMGFSQGFVKEQTSLFSPNPESFGHPGAGGALGWADPREGLAIGYVMNKMGYHVRSPRAVALCHAIYESLR